jgi:tmRNA-binding protein
MIPVRVISHHNKQKVVQEIFDSAKKRKVLFNKMKITSNIQAKLVMDLSVVNLAVYVVLSVKKIKMLDNNEVERK